jgi:hypothetical protein
MKQKTKDIIYFTFKSILFYTFPIALAPIIWSNSRWGLAKILWIFLLLEISGTLYYVYRISKQNGRFK